MKNIRENNQTERIIIAGFGGQGIMLAGKILIRTGLLMGRSVTYIPSYGAEVRGGTAHCHVIISENEIASPVIARPDSCLVMNSPSLAKFQERVRENGHIFINSSMVKEAISRKDLVTVRIEANDVAEGLGSIKAANMVMLGAYLKYSGLLRLPPFRSALKAVIPPRHRDLLDINLKAIQSGYELA